MTHDQKYLAFCLLDGMYLTRSAGQWTLMEGKQNPIQRLSDATVEYYRHLLKAKDKYGRYYISRQLVRKEHGKSYIKQQYKKQLQNKPVTGKVAA